MQQRFADGILWATLGQEPDVLALLTGWARELGDPNFSANRVETAAGHLRSLLHERAALLVVDDVWDPGHAQSFRVGGPRCQVLITTRRADVAEAVGADLHQMDVMQPEQSLALLSARLDRTLEEPERADALRLAGAVDRTPPHHPQYYLCILSGRPIQPAGRHLAGG